ncbi:MAG TPA: zf-HC2 domain-containing protein [Terriglobia bacterium]|nr:zf-HC2 domain-containing protein [Terriglobia bacterium]
MSCHEFERLVALYVEGDLDGTEHWHVEAHLLACPACRNLADDLKESQAAFKSIRQDGPNPAVLLSVRTRVLEDVAGMQSKNWLERLFLGGLRQRATLAGFALLLVGGWLLRNSRQHDMPAAVPPPPVVAVHEPQVFTETVAPTPPPEPETKPLVRRPRPMPAVAAPEEHVEAATPVTIKFVTDNPNVIIYWLGDERKGD